jgi:signal transduction histidine kinase
LFGQAIINLISNAVKYTPIDGEVRIRTRMQDTEAVIEVQDNGMGIPPDALPKLFERFYRVPQNSHAAAGTGLGLALVKYIVTNIHDGSISVTSQVDRGSNFAIRIPLGHRGRSTRSAATQKAAN